MEAATSSSSPGVVNVIDDDEAIEIDVINDGILNTDLLTAVQSREQISEQEPIVVVNDGVDNIEVVPKTDWVMNYPREAREALETYCTKGTVTPQVWAKCMEAAGHT